MSRLERQRDSQTRWTTPNCWVVTAGFKCYPTTVEKGQECSILFDIIAGLWQREKIVFICESLRYQIGSLFEKPYYCLFLVIMQDSGVRLIQLNWFTFSREAKWKMVGYESIIHSNYNNYKGSMLKKTITEQLINISKKLTWLYFYFAACCEIILKPFLTSPPELWAVRFQGTSLNNMGHFWNGAAFHIFFYFFCRSFVFFFFTIFPCTLGQGTECH